MELFAVLTPERQKAYLNKLKYPPLSLMNR